MDSLLSNKENNILRTPRSKITGTALKTPLNATKRTVLGGKTNVYNALVQNLSKQNVKFSQSNKIAVHRDSELAEIKEVSEPNYDTEIEFIPKSEEIRLDDLPQEEEIDYEQLGNICRGSALLGDCLTDPLMSLESLPPIDDIDILELPDSSPIWFKAGPKRSPARLLKSPVVNKVHKISKVLIPTARKKAGFMEPTASARAKRKPSVSTVKITSSRLKKPKIIEKPALKKNSENPIDIEADFAELEKELL